MTELTEFLQGMKVAADLIDKKSKEWQHPGNGAIYSTAQACKREIYKEIERRLETMQSSQITHDPAS